jgi:hypothetical protein
MVVIDPVQAQFTLVAVEENTWDVIIIAEPAVLRAFQETYNAHYIEKSVFGDNPVAIVPDFPNKMHAESWKEYWIQAFADPENACKTCQTVQEMFDKIVRARSEQ